MSPPEKGASHQHWKFSFLKFEIKRLCDIHLLVLTRLEDTARYAGLLLAPAEGFGRGIFPPLGKKKLIMLFWPILGHFWCPFNLGNC